MFLSSEIIFFKCLILLEPKWTSVININDTFDVILFENSKNIEQMDGILKSKDYLSFNGLYFHKNFLK